MTTYYRVLRRVKPDDLHTSSGNVLVLRMIPADGHITFEHFAGIGKNMASGGIRYAWYSD